MNLNLALALLWGCGVDAPEAATGHEGHDGHDVVGMSGHNAAAIVGLSVVPVRVGVGEVARRAPASVAFDPTATVRVTSQTGGQLRSLTVPAPGGAVTRGQILARVYDPGVHAMLEELSVARTLDETWRDAAASRARANGVSDDVVRTVLAGGEVPETVAIRAPAAGVVASRPIAEGAWIAPGGLVVVLVDPAAVLVDLVVDGSEPAAGTTVRLRDLAGSVVGSAVVVGTLPEATAAGLRVRVKPAAPVTPGRPLVAEWTETIPDALWIPASSLVDTGTRRVVFVATDAGFVPRPVEPGRRAGAEIEIRSGVVAGEAVAANGAFLLDSETQIGSMGHAGHGG